MRTSIGRVIAATLALGALPLAAHAGTATFTWIDTGNDSATGSGTLTLTDSSIGSNWAALVGVTSGTQGQGGFTLAGTATTITSGFATPPVDDLSAFSFQWTVSGQQIAQETLAGLSSLQVGSGGWTVAFDNTAGAYILYNTANLTENAGIGNLNLQYNGENSIAYQNSTAFPDYGDSANGYFKLTSVNPVPLPDTLSLMVGALGLLGAGTLLRRTPPTNKAV